MTTSPQAPTVGLVFGYLYNIDRQNEEAQRLALPARFSIVLKAYAWDECGKSFDRDVLFDLLSLVLGWIGIDALSVTTEAGDDLAFASVGALEAHYRGLSVEEGPFTRLRALERERVKCLVETEPYHLVGGPMPYHDQYVFAFYVSNDQHADLQTLIVRRCVELDVPFSEIRQGGERPQFTLATRLRRLLP